MHIDEISKGGAIEVEVKCNDKTVNFKSDIVELINNSILITPIRVNEQTIGFSDNCHINFLYVLDGKLYLWEQAIIKLVKYNGEVYHMIDISGEGKPHNRRDSFRMYVGEDMPLYVNTPNGPTAISVLVKDISETGVGFITKEDIEIERTIRLKLKDDNTLINLSGVIVRKERLEHLDSNLYGCKLTEKNHKLGKFIARKQGELLRKKSSPTPTPTSASTPLPASKDKKLKKIEYIIPDKKG